MDNTIVIGVRITKALKDRIDELSKKGMTNRNHWIIRTLTKAAYKHQAEKPPMPCDKTPNK